jgi:hypothetical protein
MTDIQRESPVSFSAIPVKTEKRDHWRIVLEYKDEGVGPWLIDLSHRARWDVQARNISDLKIFGNAVPETPNACAYTNGVMISRMNGTQVSVWHLSQEPAESFTEPSVTDTTDATVFLALAGKNVFAVAEKLTDLDILNPQKQIPFLMQGPFSHVPCQIVVANRKETEESPFAPGKSGLLFLTCSRGYAHDMVHAILEAGEVFGLRPAGEGKFMEIFEQVMTK